MLNRRVLLSLAQTARQLWANWRMRLWIAISDQGLSSGASFVAHILLARWLQPSEYGRFAIAFSVLVVLSGPHSAFLTDPLGSIGPRLFGRAPRAYLRTLIVLHAAVTSFLALAVVAITLGRYSVTDSSAAMGFSVALAIPTVLGLWLLRAACYLMSREDVALRASVVYATFLLIGLGATRLSQTLTPAMALIVMSGASLAAAAYVVRALQLVSSLELENPSAVVDEHWRYGRWILGGAASHSAAYALIVPLVGATTGLESAGVFRALQNLVLPLEKLLTAISMVLYPQLSMRVAERGPDFLRSYGWALVGTYTVIATTYALLIAAMGRELMLHVYGGGAYSDNVGLLPGFAVFAITSSIALSLGVLARAANLPGLVFGSKAAAAVVSLALTGVLIGSLGLRGVVAALAASALIESIIAAAGLIRKVRSG